MARPLVVYFKDALYFNHARRVYTSVNGAAFNFASPAATVTYARTNRFTATLGPYSDGDQVLVIVRSVSASGVVDQNQLAQIITVRSTAPTAPSISVQVTNQ